MSVKKTGNRKPSRRPATTVEGRENQLISQAYDLAEKQIQQGTAAAQVVTHFLKLGSTRERLEQEKIKKENLLLSAKIEQIANQSILEELFKQAIEAMRSYTGHSSDDD